MDNLSYRLIVARAQIISDVCVAFEKINSWNDLRNSSLNVVNLFDIRQLQFFQHFLERSERKSQQMIDRKSMISVSHHS